MDGKVRINTHYYEDGNVGLKDIKSIKDNTTFQGGDKAEEAKAIVYVIEKNENRIQKALENMYENMGDLFFKHMRRALPGKI